MKTLIMYQKAVAKMSNRSVVRDAKERAYPPIVVSHLENVISAKCRTCNSVKPPYSHHCKTCGHCIARMDHHCPWVNNCVGMRTQKLFLLFLLYVFVGTVYALAMVVPKCVACLSVTRIYCLDLRRPNMLLLIVVSLFVSLLFGLFTMIMAGDQLILIKNNTSTIDKIKGNYKRNRQGFWKQLKVVFGGDFSINWFLPIEIKAEIDIEKEY